MGRGALKVPFSLGFRPFPSIKSILSPQAASDEDSDAAGASAGKGSEFRFIGRSRKINGTMTIWEGFSQK